MNSFHFTHIGKTYSYEMFSASSIVSGSLMPFVSGKNDDNIPAIPAIEANITIGSGPQTWAWNIQN